MTTTDEILALVARRDRGQQASAAPAVTEADVAAFRAAAARGQGSAVVRALLAIRPAAAHLGQSDAHPAPPPVPSSSASYWAPAAAAASS